MSMNYKHTKREIEVVIFCYTKLFPGVPTAAYELKGVRDDFKESNLIRHRLTSGRCHTKATTKAKNHPADHGGRWAWQPPIE